MKSVGKMHVLSNQISRNESEYLASCGTCKFIPVIQYKVSTRDLLHSAMFLALEQLVIKFFSFYVLNLTKNIVSTNMMLSLTT